MYGTIPHYMLICGYVETQCKNYVPTFMHRTFYIKCMLCCIVSGLTGHERYLICTKMNRAFFSFPQKLVKLPVWQYVPMDAARLLVNVFAHRGGLASDVIDSGAILDVGCMVPVLAQMSVNVRKGG